eukprot:TRINITY_DN1852_c3_g2_i1.p1 TRINITY_DN1852_c3_g2~~TRINITY_DN1852_c3_g2_i1.p1  ORF type:complete len:1923 (-),score=635.24 TRINITY_DN1852_c3_g2_i1:335-6103(-)
MTAGVKVVSEKWIADSIKAGKMLDETLYALSSEEPKKHFFTYEQEFVSEDELKQQKEKEKKEQEEKQIREERIKSASLVTLRKPREIPTGPVSKVRTLKFNAPGSPYFPRDFQIVYYKSLQWTDIGVNHNKYYVLELHKASEKGKEYFRLFSHYGRTDDLVTNPNAGQKECRFYDTEDEAENGFANIIQEKTGKKGYRPVELVFSNIGSEALKALLAQSAGVSTTTTTNSSSNANETQPASSLDPIVQKLVIDLFEEASNELSSVIGPAKITEKGIQTPLGVTTLKQIELGQQILEEVYECLVGTSPTSSTKLSDLSNRFFTAIPHSVGRSSIQSLTLRTVGDYTKKSELLQLMRDLLLVFASTSGSKLNEIDMKYTALKCKIENLKSSSSSSEYDKVYDHVIRSQLGQPKMKITNIYSLQREEESNAYKSDLFNQQQLFHGSRASNFVGILSRGILLPKKFEHLGGERRDVGMLGSGIYFGDSATTSAQYTAPDQHGIKYMLVCDVALGSVMKYTTHQYNLSSPPSGYHSVQGVRGTDTETSDFKDNEFVVYSSDQQRLRYLVAYKEVDPLLADKPTNKSHAPQGSPTKPLKGALKRGHDEVAGVKDHHHHHDDDVSSFLQSKKKTVQWGSGLLNDSLKLKPSKLETSVSTRPLKSKDDNDTMTSTTTSGKSVDFKKRATLVHSAKAALVHPATSKLSLSSSGGSSDTSSSLKRFQSVQPAKHHDIQDAIPRKKVVVVSKADKENSDVAAGAKVVQIKSLRKSLGQYAFDKLSKKIGIENGKMKRNEDQLRELFVKDRNHFKVSDLHSSLIEAHSPLYYPSFQYALETPEDISIPKLLTNYALPGVNGSSIVSIEDFKKNFEDFTCNVLKGLDWSNIIVAGGSVLGSLMNISPERRAKSFKDSDIDIFVYGLTPEEATNKMEQIFFQVQANTNASCEIVRTTNAVTIVGQYPIRHIQIVLRIYKSPAEVLMGFDVDCCCVGFDGETVWVLPRAHRALTKRYNLVDMSRRSLSYETRLYKYAKRGFSVAVPGLLRHLVPSSLYQQRPWQVKGLAKLLLFEHCLTNPDGRYDTWKPKGRRLRAYARDDFSEDRINEVQQLEQFQEPTPLPDYSNLFIPWGTQWFTEHVVRELIHRDKAQWFTTKQHVVFIGLESVLEGKSNWTEGFEANPPATPEPTTPTKNGQAFVSGPLSWMTENPGRQLTGSFHPVSDELWYDQAYCPVDTQEDLTQSLCNASYQGDVIAIRTMIRKNRNAIFGGEDSFLNRTALNFACSNGDIEIVRELIDVDVDINQLDAPTGLRPIHFAAYSGNVKIVEILLRKKVSPNITTNKQRWTPLHIASYYGHEDVVNALLDSSATEKNPVDIKGRSPLYLAAISGHEKVLRLLIDSGCEPNAQDFNGITALEAASTRGHLSCAVILSRKLVKVYPAGGVKKPLEPKKQPATNQSFNLLHALSSGDPQVIQSILEDEGVDLMQKDNTYVTALHIAATRNDADTASKLLEKAPALLNLKDSTGQTALHYAVRFFSLDVVKVLVNYALDVNRKGYLVSGEQFFQTFFPLEVEAQNLHGQTALFYAMYKLSHIHSDENLDETQGFMHCQQKQTLESIKELLIKVGAQKPYLSYFIKLPKLPSSDYVHYDPTLYPSTQVIDKMELNARERLEAEYETNQRLEKARFDFAKQTKVFKSPEKETSTSSSSSSSESAAKKQRFSFGDESSLLSSSSTLSRSSEIPSELTQFSNSSFEFGVTTSSSSTTTTSSGSPKKSTASKSSKYNSYFQPFVNNSFTSDVSSLSSSSTTIPSTSSTTTKSVELPNFNTINQQNASRFEIPPVAQEDNNSHKSVEALKQRILAFQPTQNKTTHLGKMLITVTKLFRDGKITKQQKDALKTLAIQQNKGVIGAQLMYEIDHDENELVDTLIKICHIQYL